MMRRFDVFAGSLAVGLLTPVTAALAQDGIIAGAMICEGIPNSPGFSIPMSFAVRGGAAEWSLGQEGADGHQVNRIRINGDAAALSGSYNVRGEDRLTKLTGRVSPAGIELAGKRGPRGCKASFAGAVSTGARPPFKLAFNLASVREHAPVHSVAPCRPWPKIGPDLALERFYADDDPTYSKVIPERMAIYVKLVEPLREIERLAASNTERALGRGDGARAAGRCVIEGLDGLARSNALLGKLTPQAAFERKWGIVVYSSAFAETRDVATAEEAARIRGWIRALGDAMSTHYARGLLPDRIRQRNNHTYWAALSATMAGIAADDMALLNFGVGTFRASLSDIDAEGFLANELARKGKALQYHKFSLEPLLLNAMLARANGQAISESETSSLRRLARQVLVGFDDRAAFVAKTGVEQTLVGGPAGTRTELARGDWAFAELLPHVLPDLAIDSRLDSYRPLTNAWLGGNLTFRYGRSR
jgi:poly(beta-D-mannuronate) lyase